MQALDILHEQNKEILRKCPNAGNALQNRVVTMIGSTLPDKRIVSSSGVRSEIGHIQSIIHEVWKTEPTGHHRCSPATRLASEIAWEPVILLLLERLADLRTLPEERRLPGADWPIEEAFLDAGRFTERLQATMRVAPHISLADDGEVNFAWSQNGMWVDLGFYGTGTLSFYARDKDGKELFGDDIPVMSPLPYELRALLAG